MPTADTPEPSNQSTYQPAHHSFEFAYYRCRLCKDLVHADDAIGLGEVSGQCMYCVRCYHVVTNSTLPRIAQWLQKAIEEAMVAEEQHYISDHAICDDGDYLPVFDPFLE